MKSIFKLSVLFMASCLATNAQAKMVEYVEDPYAQQAPQEIVALAQEAAEKMDFQKSYEIVVPKKAGLQINPWNQFVSSGTNPQTKNCFILVNPAWFSTLPANQQLFLLERCFMQAEMGLNPLSLKIIPWLFILFSYLLAIGLFWLLGKNARFSEQTPSVRAVRGLISFGVVMLCYLQFINPLQTKVVNYYSRKHETAIHEAVIQKTGDRQGAIQALEAYDAAIRKSLENGELLFAPFEKLFSGYAAELKK